MIIRINAENRKSRELVILFFSFFLFAANSWFPFQKFIIQKQVSLFHSM